MFTNPIFFIFCLNVGNNGPFPPLSQGPEAFAHMCDMSLLILLACFCMLTTCESVDITIYDDMEYHSIIWN